MEAKSLNKAQIEVLNALSFLNTDEDIFQLKIAITDFFAKRADAELNKLMANGTLDDAKIASFSNSHFRTPYR